MPARAARPASLLVLSIEMVQAAEQADIDALNKVREAFYEATKDRNSKSSCMRIDIEFARKIAQL